MAEAKATIRAVLLTAERSAVMSGAMRSLDHLDSGYVATAGVAWVDTDSHRVEWCLAGHLRRSCERRTARPACSGARSTRRSACPPVPRPARPPTALPARCSSSTPTASSRVGGRPSTWGWTPRAVVETLPADCDAEQASATLVRELHAAESGADVAIVVAGNP